MEIKINTDTPLSDLDRDILRLLLDGHAPSGVERDETSEDAPITAKKAPAKRAAKKASKPKPEAEPDEDDEPDEDESDEEETVDELLERAVELATKLIQKKKGTAVKKALQNQGAKKVSDLKKEKDIRAFLEELDG